jgi:Membrane protein of 12 TMs
MGWREAWRISSVAFAELSLQAIYALRQGNLPSPDPPAVVVRRARRRVTQSKVLVASILTLLAAGAALLLGAAPGIVSRPFFSVLVSPAVFRAAVLTGLLSLDVAFLWWTGLQMIPTFLASGVLPVLEPLPIDDRTLGRVAGLLYLRLFDVPALAVLIATPILVGVALGPAAGLAVIPGVACAVAFSLAVALLTGRFFVRRVLGSRGGGGRAAIRWAYLVLWVLPAFAMFVFVVAAPAFVALVARTIASGQTGGSELLLATFPFTFAALPAIAVPGGAPLPLVGSETIALFAAGAAYVALASWATVWMMDSVRRIGIAPPLLAVEMSVRNFDLLPRRPTLAVLTKDLRIASRTPGYAFLLLFPILDALALGLFTFITGPGSSAALSLALGAVTTAALLATFFGPAFFAIEVIAYSYGRTLPLADRSLILGKVALVTAVFVIASGLVLGLTALRVFQPVIFLSFVAAELPAVVAASLLELGILFRRARSKGLPIVNLYAGAWYAVAVSIPGLIVAGTPLIAFRLFGSSGALLGLSAMALVAVIELGVCAPFALRTPRGGPA